MFKITQERHNKCIGCGSCAILCPQFWEMRDDMKAHIINGQYDEQKDAYELVIEDIACCSLAADTCPVNIIKITNQQQ